MTSQQLWVIAAGVVGVIFILLLLMLWRSGTWLQTRLVTERKGEPVREEPRGLGERYPTY